MIFYYDHVIPNCSLIAKRLFSLTVGQKRQDIEKVRMYVGSVIGQRMKRRLRRVCISVKVFILLPCESPDLVIFITVRF